MGWLNKIMEGLSKAAALVAEVAKLGQIWLRIRKLEGKKQDLYTEVGEKVYQAYGEETSDAEVEPLCEKIQTLDDEIVELEAEIERIKETQGAEKEAATTEKPEEPGEEE